MSPEKKEKPLVSLFPVSQQAINRAEDSLKTPADHQREANITGRKFPILNSRVLDIGMTRFHPDLVSPVSSLYFVMGTNFMNKALREEARTRKGRLSDITMQGIETRRQAVMDIVSAEDYKLPKKATERFYVEKIVPAMQNNELDVDDPESVRSFIRLNIPAKGSYEMPKGLSALTSSLFLHFVHEGILDIDNEIFNRHVESEPALKKHLETMEQKTPKNLYSTYVEGIKEVYLLYRYSLGN